MERDEQHDKNSANEVGPGASGPGEPGYEGRVTIGDEGAAIDEADDDIPAAGT